MTGVYSSQDTGRSWIPVDGLWSAQEYLQAMLHLPSGRMIGGDWYGMLQSDIGGKNWTRANTGLHRDWVMDFALTSSRSLLNGSVFSTSIFNPSKGWRQLNQETSYDVHASENGTLFCLTATGMIRSTDDGETWESVGGPFGQAEKILEGQQGTLFCGIVERQMYRSWDTGKSWSAGLVQFEETSFEDGMVDGDGSVLLLIKEQGIVRVDSALTQTTLLLSADITGRFISIAATQDDGVIVCAEKGMFHSSDHGLIWKTLPTPIPESLVPWSMDTDRKGRIFCLFRSAEDPRIWTDFKLYTTSDLGVLWESIELPQPHQRYQLLKILPDDRLYIASSEEGLFRTRDVVTTIEQQNPPAQPDERSITICPQPAQERLTLVLNQSTNVRTILIHDCMGRLVSRQDLQFANGVTTMHLDVSGLRSGMYIVSIVDDRQVYHRKFLVVGDR